MNHAINFDKVSKTFKSKKHTVTALKNISFSVAKGSICGVIGQSGAGKSTLLRLVNGLDNPTTGEVSALGQTIKNLSRHDLRLSRQKIGMIFQHFNLLNSKNVFDNIALPLRLIGTNDAVIQSRVSELLDLTGLAERQYHYPLQLSGGQKQRVAIARALACEPQILLSDESTSALDPETTQSILDLLSDINKRLGITILLITHEMQVIQRICDDVVLLNQGEIVEHGPVEKILVAPKTEMGRDIIHKAFGQVLSDRLESIKKSEKEDGDALLLNLSFSQQAAVESLISDTIKRFNIDINVLQARLEPIKKGTLGFMVIALTLGDASWPEIYDYMTVRGITIEELGYVPTTL